MKIEVQDSGAKVLHLNHHETEKVCLELVKLLSNGPSDFPEHPNAFTIKADDAFSVVFAIVGD